MGASNEGITGIRAESSAAPDVQALLEQVEILRAEMRKRTIVGVTGKTLRDTGAGQIMDLSGLKQQGSASAARPHPFQVLVGGASQNPTLRVEPGLVNGKIPTYGFRPLDSMPQIPLGSGLRTVVYLRLQWDMEVEDDYLHGATLRSVEVGIGGDVPQGSPSAGVFYYPLATLDRAMVTGQFATTSLSARLCDDGSAKGLGVMYVSKA